MSETFRMWVEILFNISYLVVVWGFVIAMRRHQDQVLPQYLAVAKRVRWAFVLLAAGDTGHVGFRVIAYALGGLEAKPALLGVPVDLVGLGALATAITVTFFYMLMLDIWRLRFNRSLGWFGWLLLAAGVVRLVIMAFPQNEWGQVVPPYDWSLARNLPLVIQGLGVMALILRDAIANRDQTFKWIGFMIMFSFIFYTPVILFVARVPMLGMLMIPKTLAYLGVAFLAYHGLYRPAAETTAVTAPLHVA